MKFALSKCGVLIKERDKTVKRDELVLHIQRKMKEIDKMGYRYLGVFKIDKIMQKEMKTQLVKEYVRRNKLILKSK